MTSRGIINTERPYCSEWLEADLQKLFRFFPIFKLNTIGYSFLGKPIYEVKIGEGSRKIHFNGSFHANEWITSLILMKWLEDLLKSIQSGVNETITNPTQILQEWTISIVPMVNPDGVDLVTIGPPPNNWSTICKSINLGSDDFSQWKANIRGVDLNNQFPAKWEIEQERKIPKSPAPRDFPGYTQLSEPEARAMLDLTVTNEFDRVLAFHSQGEEFYWGYENYHPEESAYLAQIFEKVSGYKGIEYIDSHAGYRDWFIQAFQKPGFTIECGFGENPLPLEQFDKIYEDVKKIILASLMY
ncbi:MAG: peptidase [Bacillales bacterium]|jgi:g-D-glutamyl-meso-diaminopimelate peptidase|nr:peptidase [Bacillales bacterium]